MSDETKSEPRMTEAQKAEFYVKNPDSHDEFTDKREAREKEAADKAKKAAPATTPVPVATPPTGAKPK